MPILWLTSLILIDLLNYLLRICLFFLNCLWYLKSSNIILILGTFFNTHWIVSTLDLLYLLLVGMQNNIFLRKLLIFLKSLLHIFLYILNLLFIRWITSFNLTSLSSSLKLLFFRHIFRNLFSCFQGLTWIIFYLITSSLTTA